MSILSLPQCVNLPVSGTFNNVTGLIAESQCQSCIPGSYCDSPGLDSPVGLCDAGYYCLGGSNASNPVVDSDIGGPCPTGTYCPTGTAIAMDCAPGMYNPTPLQPACLDCPEGYYCEARASSITACPKGQWNMNSSGAEFYREIFKTILMAQSKTAVSPVR